MKNLENMSDDELMDAWTSAGDKLAAAKEEVTKFSDEFKRRNTQTAMQSQLDRLNDTERAALAQLLIPDGIESQEKVNE